MAQSDKETESGKGVAAVERALQIVAQFELYSGVMTLAELARRTGFYKSTLLRLLVSLDEYGYVTRVGEQGYRLGPMAFRLGLAYEKLHRMADFVKPVLEQLVRNGTESASFHMRQDATTRLCMFRVDSHHSTVDRVGSGDVLPLDRGAAGRLLIGCDGVSTEEADRIRPHLLVLSVGERDPNCAGLATPVIGPDQCVCGALSLSGPRERFNEETVLNMSKLLLRAAADLSRSLGGNGFLQLRRLQEIEAHGQSIESLSNQMESPDP